MDKVFDANYRITNMTTKDGEIVDLEINNKKVDLVDYDEDKKVEMTENGRIEIVPTLGKNGMKKVVVTTDVKPNLDNNRIHSIDVSEYESPIEIIPTKNKEGMKKVTVSLKNFDRNLYAWKNSCNLVYTSEIPNSDKDLDVYVAKSKTDVIGHTLCFYDNSDLEIDSGRYESGAVLFEENSYIRSPSDDIRV